MDSLQAVLKASRAHLSQPQKRANDGFYNAVQEATARQLRMNALANAGALGLLGAGVGAGTRGLLGLFQMAHRNASKPDRTVPAPLAIDLPLQEHEEEKLGSLSNFLKGDYAQTTAGVPWAMPAAV